MVGWLEFYVPFQHKYGYIRDESAGMDTCCYDSTNRFILVTLVISLRASLLPPHLELRPSCDQWREALFSICHTLVSDE